MNLIINKVMEFEIMHESDCYRIIKIFTCTSVTKSYFTITSNLNTFPFSSVSLILIKVIKYFRNELALIFSCKLIPFKVSIIISKIKCIHDIILVCTVEYRCRNIKSENLCRKA